MQRMMMVSVGLTCFAVGCLGATVYGPLVVPAASASASVQKWEQLCVPTSDDIADKKIAHSSIRVVNDPKEGWNRVLKEYGAQGWELVGEAASDGSGYINAFCFKRPLA